MSKEIIVKLSGTEDSLKEGWEIKDARSTEDILSLLSTESVKALNNANDGKFGLDNKLYFDPETNSYSLIRDGQVLVKGCQQIIPLTKNYQRGVIYCKSPDGNGYFLEYKNISKKAENDEARTPEFSIEIVKYCIYNESNGQIQTIRNDEELAISGIQDILKKCPEKPIYIIEANDQEKMSVLFLDSEVRKLIESGKEVFGASNKLYIEPETGCYSLVRKGLPVIMGCHQIIPISKPNDQRGVIYCQGITGQGYFLNYEIDASKNFNSQATRYCIINEQNGEIEAIKNYKKAPQEKKEQEPEITVFIKRYPKSFTINEIKDELIQANIIEKKDVALLLSILEKMEKSGDITRFTGEEKNIYYQVVKHKARSLSSN